MMTKETILSSYSIDMKYKPGSQSAQAEVRVEMAFGRFMPGREHAEGSRGTHIYETCTPCMFYLQALKTQTLALTGVPQ